jgi:hypothetical protein
MEDLLRGKGLGGRTVDVVGQHIEVGEDLSDYCGLFNEKA